MADQWDSEADWYKLLVSGQANLSALISPHNEHRIAATRLFNGFVFSVRGGWHPILVAYLQIPMVALVITFLSYLILKSDFRYRIAAVILVVLSQVLPYSWSNILSGFQNQFYFMLLAAVLSFYLMIYCSGKFLPITAVLLALLSPFTMAGGLATIIALAIILTLRVVAQRDRRLYHSTLMLGLIIGGGLHALNLVRVPGHDSLKAQNLTELIISTLKILGWPQVPIGYIFWGLIGASLWNGCRNTLRKGEFHLNSDQLFTLALIAWLLIQAIATANARTHSDLMSSRYQQMFALILPACFLCIGSFGAPSVLLRWKTAFACLLVLGLVVRTIKEWPYMERGVREARYARTAILEAYRHASFSELKAKDQGGALGYFNAERIWQQIKTPQLEKYHIWLRNP